MNLDIPISSLMTTDLVLVHAKDNLSVVKEIMDLNNIHHVPVVDFGKLVGLISRSDILHFLTGLSGEAFEETHNKTRLKFFRAEDLMTDDLECLHPDDILFKALELFQKNQFHSIPIVDRENTLMGIFTTYDVVNILLEDSIASL